MTKLKLIFVSLIALNLVYFDTVCAQHIQKNSLRHRFHRYHSVSRDPELEFLLKLLRGGPSSHSNKKNAAISHNLRFLSSVLGKDVRVEAIKRGKVRYIVHTNYNSLKFRLWLVNTRTSAVIDGLYRPIGLYEHRNGVFELVLGSREANLVLKFVPRGKKYQIIMKYRQY
jgi:hypothetical protein